MVKSFEAGPPEGQDMSADVLKLHICQDEKTGYWVAACVDFDMVVQAKRREDLPKAVGHAYYARLVVAFEHGLAPRKNPAPQYIKDRWEESLKKGTQVDLFPHDDFVPDWWPAALEKIQAITASRKKEVLRNEEQLLRMQKPSLKMVKAS